MSPNPHSYLVQQKFDEVARTYWGKQALLCQGSSVTFGELSISSNRLAHSLTRHGIQRGDRILIMLPKSLQVVRAMLATLKSDATYVPIDPRGPRRRTMQIVQDCAPSGVICDRSRLGELSEALGEMNRKLVFWVVDCARADGLPGHFVCEDDIGDEPPWDPSYSNIDSDVAYILYTSGSTGTPKGVMISHANIFNYVTWAVDYFNVDSTSNILNTSLFHYDMSTFDIYCAVHTGAAMTIVPESSLVFPRHIVEMIEESGITVWKAAASLLSSFVKTKSLQRGRMPSLRKIIFSGETLPARYLIEWMQLYPEKEFYNAYGPTECTGISTCYRVQDVPQSSREPIPIGRACANTEVLCLVDGTRLARPGETGELYIRGSSVGLGYWKDQEKTRSSFIPNPLSGEAWDRTYRTGDMVRQLENGNWLFLGRGDSQTKVMGHRVDLAEIDAALLDLDAVSDAAGVILEVDGTSENTLVAFVELKSDGNAEEILKRLREVLPHHMVPRAVMPVDCIRRLGNGKVDRQSFKDEYLEHTRNR